MESISALYPKGTVCRGLSRPDALQTRMLTLKGNLHIDCLIIFFFFQEERFQMVFDLAQELIDEDYHRADVISAK